MGKKKFLEKAEKVLPQLRLVSGMFQSLTWFVGNADTWCLPFLPPLPWLNSLDKSNFLEELALAHS